ncbi:MAG: hypothetical protein AAFN10_26410 [Bacteroidota bacterium]
MPTSSLQKLLLLAFMSPMVLAKAQSLAINWQKHIETVSSFSSPRTIDLNGDSIQDIVIGAGIEEMPSPQGIYAFDGVDGQIIWQRYARDQIYGSPLFHDLNQDGTPDVIISGRSAQLMALDGTNGFLLWEFWSDTQGSPLQSDWFNFYLPQWIGDQDGDSIPELIITNGGDPRLIPSDKDRPAGYLMAISGANGQILQVDSMPDGQETYSSPLLVDYQQTGDPYILFGSGGETVGGSLWEVQLSDFLQNGLSNAQALVSNPEKGFVAVSSLADLNHDGVPDIIVPQLRENIIAIDGNSKQEIWRHTEPFHDFYVSPSIGQFIGDESPDIFTTASLGNWPFYQSSIRLLIDGSSGQVVWTEQGFPFQLCSGLALDWDNDGFDELIFPLNEDTASNGQYYQHQLYLYDFNDQLSYPLDSIRPGVMMFSMPIISDLEKDQNWELIFTTHDNTDNWYQPAGFSIYSVDLGRFAERLAWGGYQGSLANGFYPQDLVLGLASSQIAGLAVYPNPVQETLRLRSAAGQIIVGMGADKESAGSGLLILTKTTYLVRF